MNNAREITVKEMIKWLEKEPPDNKLKLGLLKKGFLNEEFVRFVKPAMGYGKNETIIGVETTKVNTGNITQGQWNIIKFIQDILETKFIGINYNDADNFIKKYKKIAESKYRNYDYKNAPKRNQYKNEDWYERNTPDMYDIPNH